MACRPQGGEDCIQRGTIAVIRYAGGMRTICLYRLHLILMASGLVAVSVGPAVAQEEKLHFTYHWHLEQPIYWPDQNRSAVADRYEAAWESILRTDAGAANPENNLRDIFGKADRVAVYQYRVRDAIDDIDWAAEAGAQVSYSGGLIRNVESLGQANQLGYGPNWAQAYQQARGWRTIGASKPRLDVVVFPFHHALMPLIDERAQRMEIRTYQHLSQSTWGGAAPHSRGFFPSEMAFSTRLVRVLAEEGIDWSIVSAEKISRATEDFPVVLGSGGVNCDPPNRADMINPAAGNYYRVQISRGCAPAEAVPFALTPQRVRAVDPYDNPAAPTVHEIIAVPASQSISWEDGYNPLGIQHFDAIQPYNDPARPMLVVLAHDGDNAFGGGFSYYREATPNLVSSAQASGYHATVVEEYLADHPVPADAVAHVEDGAWVNADSDFGSPQFWNWNYPPVDSQGRIDIENGWAEDIRNWAVITAAQNHVATAEDISAASGMPVRVNKVVDPSFGATPAERAWHFFLGALNSGYMYYGTALDMEVKPTIACNEALQHTAGLIASGTDATPPTIWIPQRWPWNPGELNFGEPYGYQATVTDTSFHVWTFAYDVSGLSSVVLKYRLDADGINPLGDWQNETYAGGSSVGAWQSAPMVSRAFPAENIYNDNGIDFFEMPQSIADQYYAQLSGFEDVLIDYYIEAVDSLGNIERSPIQHVWVGDGEGAAAPGDDRVTLVPDVPVADEDVTITYNAAGGPLAGAGQVFMHWGTDGWSNMAPSDAAMNATGQSGQWSATVRVPAEASQLNMVFNDGAGIWDNNNDQDWGFDVQGGSEVAPAFVVDGELDDDYVLLGDSHGLTLHAGYDGGTLYLAATPAGGTGRDHFVLLNATPAAAVSAPWAKAGTVTGWDAFVGNEQSNGFVGWFDASAATSLASGTVTEASINLLGELGGEPPTFALAMAAYADPDAGTLLEQLPVGNGDGNIDINEWYVLTPSQLTPVEPCPADVNTDGQVNDSDFFAWVSAFTTDPATPESAAACDVNRDGACSDSDFFAWVTLFLSGC